jgi:hypothetical protein
MINRTLSYLVHLVALGILILSLQTTTQAQVLPSQISDRFLSGPTKLAIERNELYQETGDTALVDNAVTEYLKMCASIQALHITAQTEGDVSTRFDELKTEKSGGNAAEGGMDCTFTTPDSLFFCPTSKFATAGCSSLRMPTDWVVALGIQQEINGICPSGVHGTVALMVQAVLWRTYGVKRNLEGAPANRGQAVALVGTPILRCFLAAQMTTGQVLLGSDPSGNDYGKLIFAAYNARCNGNATRSAQDGVWHNTGTCSEGGSNVSYLQSVTCSGHDNCDGTGETPCCGTNDGQSIYGHGVGACQHGIVAFAKLGWTYEEILLHYFSGKVCIAKPATCTLSAPAPTKTEGCDNVQLTAQPPISGTAPYSYSWSTGETGISINTQQKGTYIVTVTDAVCSITRSVKVTSIPNSAPFQIIAFPTHPNCAASTTGKVMLFGAQSTWASEWSDGQITIGKWRHNMPAGDYSVTVVNNKGCTATASVTLMSQNCDLSISMTIGTCNTRWLKPVIPTNMTITEYWWRSYDSAIPNTYADSLPVWLTGEYILFAVTTDGDTLTAKHTVPGNLWNTYRPLALPRPCDKVTLNGSTVSDISWAYLGGTEYIIDNEGPHYAAYEFTKSVRVPGLHTFTTIYTDGCEVSTQYEIATKYSTTTDIPISIVGDSLVADLSGIGIPAEFTEFQFFWSMRDSTTGWYTVFVDATVQSLRHAIPITENGTYKLQVRHACDAEYTLFGEIAINYTIGNPVERSESYFQSNTDKLTASPNPTTGITIIMDAYGKVIVFSATGQTVASFQADGSARIDLTGKPNGIYIAHISNSKGVMHNIRIALEY